MSDQNRNDQNITDTDTQFFGHVAVLGAPNAGKSTLTNALVGEKVSIVTHKVQTTRTRILGIANIGNAQMVLVDTPGVFAPKKAIDRALVQEAWAALEMADVMLVMVDCARKTISADTMALVQRIAEFDQHDGPVALVLNKVDDCPKQRLLEFSAQLHQAYDFDAVFMISALKGSGLKDVVTWLSAQMPEGPWGFDAEQITTLPMQIAAAEITREKLFLNCHQEIPYSTAVINELWEEGEKNRLVIHQTIILERDSQKGIVIGKGGAMLKRIGTHARTEIQDVFGRKVHLDLRVKVDRDWTDKAKAEQLIKGVA